jgi:hypothetical protein
MTLLLPHRRAAWTLIGALTLIGGFLLGDPGTASAKKRKKASHPSAPVVPPAAVPAAPPPPAVSNLPLAALRLECSSDGPSSRLCDSVAESAISVIGRRYRLLDQAKLESLFQREPSLRGCRRDECRAAIAEQLEVMRLIDIIIQAPKHRGLVGNIAIFDPIAKGLAADAEIQLKRDEHKLRTSIEEAVDLVLNTQRLTAALRVDIKPAGAKVKLIDSRGGTRELTDAERDGSREVRVFLGTYTVRAEKPGFLAQDQPVAVAQTGATATVALKSQPVAVKFEWTPDGTRVSVDGEPVDSRDKVIEVAEGPHRVEAIAPRGAPFDPMVLTIDVRVGMEPVRIALQRLTELHIAAPAGYKISVDGQLVPSTQIQAHGLVADASVTTTPGPHTVTATSWHGHTISQKVEAESSTSTDAQVRPPSLAPGAVLGSIGLVAAAAGTALFIVGYTRDICVDSSCLTVFNPNLPGGLLVGLGGAAFIAGAAWFGWAASNHPRFHHLPTAAPTAPPPRLSLLPVLSGRYAGVLSELRF